MKELKVLLMLFGAGVGLREARLRTGFGLVLVGVLLVQALAPVRAASAQAPSGLSLSPSDGSVGFSVQTPAVAHKVAVYGNTTGGLARQTSTDATLSALSVSPKDIVGFKSRQLTYEVGVAANVTSATVTATATNSGATVAYSGTDADSVAAGHQLALTAGHNSVTVTVTAEDTTTIEDYVVTVNRGVTTTFGWKAGDDIEARITVGNSGFMGNNGFRGIWSDGATMWVADIVKESIFAYTLSTGARDSNKDFNTLDAATNHNPTGIWSDSTTMWVADAADKKLYAYNLSTKTYDSAKDFNTLDAANNDYPTGIWSDGTTMWVADRTDSKLYAYVMSTKARDDSKDIALASVNNHSGGIWSDETTMWVADDDDGKLYAYDMAAKTRNPALDFGLSGHDQLHPFGIWSDGTTVWVAEQGRRARKVFSYNHPLYAVSAAVDGTSLAVTFNRNPSAGAGLANTAFVVNKTPEGGSEGTVALSGSPSVNAKTVTLTLSAAVVATDTDIKVSYTKPTTGSNNKLVDSLGNDVVAITDLAVRNNTANATATAPGQPTGLTATATGRNRIDLVWTAPASSGGAAINGYKIEVSTDGNAWTDRVANSGSTATAYSHTGLAANSTRHYRVSAINSVGAGTVSATATDTTDPPPSSDATLSALSVSPKDIVGFAADRTAYEVGVAAAVTSVTVMAAAADSDAKLVYSRTDADTVTAGHQLDLTAGRNYLAVVVTAEDGATQKTYELSVNRGVTAEYGWKASEDLDGLMAAGNDEPHGVWSDGATIWVTDDDDDKLYAYKASDKARDSSEDLPLEAGNDTPRGIWSDGTTMWVVDGTDDKLYAYSMSTKARDSSEDLALTADNDHPYGIWSNDTTMWVVDTHDEKLYAYSMSTKAPDSSEDLPLTDRNFAPLGIWSDDTTMWVVDTHGEKLYAYNLANKAYDSSKDFNTLDAAGHFDATGAGSDGTTMWIVDSTPRSESVFSYNLPLYAVSATVTGRALTVTFSQDLATAAPARSAFAVKKTSGGTETTAALTGTPAVSAKTVTLTLSTAITATDTDIKVSYTKPGSGNTLAKSGGNEVSSFADLAVLNTIAATVPGAPTGLTATATGPERIDLAWSAPASTGGAAIIGYKIESSDGTGFTALVASQTATAYAHTGLAANSTRHYRVSAINGVGTGAASATATATTPTPEESEGSEPEGSGGPEPEPEPEGSRGSEPGGPEPEPEPEGSEPEPEGSGGPEPEGSEPEPEPGPEPEPETSTRITACESGAVNPAHPFGDVPTTSFAAKDVGCIYELEVTTGTTDTAYSPDQPVTREQMASFIARLYQAITGQQAPTTDTPFTDTARTSFAYDDIGRIYGLGITTGTTDTAYSPDQPVTREQMASFIARLYQAITGQQAPTTDTPFTDTARTSFAYDDIGRIYGLGITTGTTYTAFSPDQPVTREQMASFIARLYRALTQPS